MYSEATSRLSAAEGDIPCVSPQTVNLTSSGISISTMVGSSYRSFFRAMTIW